MQARINGHFALASASLILLTSSLAAKQAQAESKPPAAHTQTPSSKQKSAVGESATKTVNNDWSKFLAAANTAALAGNNDEAESKIQQAISSASKAGNAKAALQCSTALANFYAGKKDKQPDELSLRENNLASAEKLYGAKSAQYASALAQQANLSARKGDIDKARESIANALQILENSDEKYPLEMADCYEATAQQQIAQSTFGLADDSLKKALELRQTKLADSDPVMISSCNEYADLLTQLDRKSEASKYKQRVILARATGSAISSSADDGAGTASKTGTKSATKSNIFSKLMEDAKTAATAHDTDLAISNCKLALAEAEKSAGKDGRLAYALVHLGDYNSAKGQKQEAEALYRKAIDLRQQFKATKTLGMARNLERLANLDLQNKKTSEAQQLISQALDIEIALAAPAEMQANAAQILLSVCMMNKDMNQAEETAKRLQLIADKLSGTSAAMKKRMATAMLGGIYMQSGRRNEGVELMKSLGGKMSRDNASYAETVKQEYATIEKTVDASEEAGFSS